MMEGHFSHEALPKEVEAVGHPALTRAGVEAALHLEMKQEK